MSEQMGPMKVLGVIVLVFLALFFGGCSVMFLPELLRYPDQLLFLPILGLLIAFGCIRWIMSIVRKND